MLNMATQLVLGVGFMTFKVKLYTDHEIHQQTLLAQFDEIQRETSSNSLTVALTSHSTSQVFLLTQILRLSILTSNLYFKAHEAISFFCSKPLKSFPR